MDVRTQVPRPLRHYSGYRLRSDRGYRRRRQRVTAGRRRGREVFPAFSREEVKIYMLLQAYTFVRVTGGDFRSRLHDRFVELTRSETGATAAEYALLVSLIAIVIVVGAFALGNAVNDRLQNTADCIDTASGAPC
jgi:pilus assembly protein Flp/PilA